MSDDLQTGSDPHAAHVSVSPPDEQEPPSPPPRPKLSLNEMTTYRWLFPQEVEAYRSAGIGAIGVWRPKLSDFGEEKGIDLLQEAGLRVSSLSWAGGFTGANSYSFNEAVRDAREAIRLAAKLKADCLVMIGGARSGHILTHARRLVVDGLKHLADMAALYNVPLALQPMHPMFANEWTFLATIDETLDVIDQCDHPFVQMAFDVYHLWKEPNLLDRIRDVAPRVATVQLNDWRDPPRSDTDRLLPGDGEIPLADIVHAFVDAGYRSCFEISVWSEELWNSDYVDLIRVCRERFESLCPQPVQ